MDETGNSIRWIFPRCEIKLGTHKTTSSKNSNGPTSQDCDKMSTFSLPKEGLGLNEQYEQQAWQNRQNPSPPCASRAKRIDSPSGAYSSAAHHAHRSPVSRLEMGPENGETAVVKYNETGGPFLHLILPFPTWGDCWVSNEHWKKPATAIDIWKWTPVRRCDPCKSCWTCIYSVCVDETMMKCRIKHAVKIHIMPKYRMHRSESMIPIEYHPFIDGVPMFSH